MKFLHISDRNIKILPGSETLPTSQNNKVTTQEGVKTAPSSQTTQGGGGGGQNGPPVPGSTRGFQNGHPCIQNPQRNYASRWFSNFEIYNLNQNSVQPSFLPPPYNFTTEESEEEEEEGWSARAMFWGVILTCVIYRLIGPVIKLDIKVTIG